MSERVCLFDTPVPLNGKKSSSCTPKKCPIGMSARNATANANGKIAAYVKNTNTPSKPGTLAAEPTDPENASHIARTK